MEEKKNHMILMTGLPGAGKTKFAKRYAHENRYRYLSIDEFYKATFGTDQIHDHEYDVWMMFYRAIHIAIEDGADVIIDTNSPTKANREEILNWFGNGFADASLFYVKTPVEECWRRNQGRTRVIPKDEFDKMVQAYEPPTAKESRWKTITTYVPDDDDFFISKA